MMSKRLFSPDSVSGAFAWYVIVAFVMTWPLVLHLRFGIPQDLGDPLLNVWILGWDATHILQFLRGHVTALSGFWNANIFYPEPLTLAYSEHLVGQAVQILPVFALTGNLILCYNLLFLSTFALSALGAFLLVCELTGNGRAAFLAGLLYGFALCRCQQLGHVQILSSQWMPFVLFGLRRYFVTRRLRPLAGAAGALVAQNLSCGYYLLFFAPFVAGYVLYEVVARRLFLDGRMWRALLMAGACVALVTVPFLLPYRAVRQHVFPPRGPAEVDAFSADVYSYVTAYPGLHLWGHRLRMFPKEEGFLFPGVVPIALGLSGALIAGGRAWRVTRQEAPAKHSGRWPTLIASRFGAVLHGDHGTGGFYVAATAAAVWLSFGLQVRSMGRPLRIAGLYRYLYLYVPGFDGVRVPGRYSMLAALFLAVLAGFAAEAIARRGRVGRLAVLALGIVFLAEGALMPLPVQAPWAGFDSGLPAALGPGALHLYTYVDSLPADAVLIEFPFGGGREMDTDAWYMYSSTHHWRRLVNGASGWSPLTYASRTQSFARAIEDPGGAWQTLVASGATHAIVHEGLYKGGEGAAISEWLRRFGAREIMLAGSHRLFAIPAAPAPVGRPEGCGINRTR